MRKSLTKTNTSFNSNKLDTVVIYPDRGIRLSLDNVSERLDVKALATQELRGLG